MNVEEEVMVLYYFWKKNKNNNRRKRSIWVRELYLHREQEGEFFLTFPKLLNDDTKFQNYYRMSRNSFNKLIDLIQPHFSVGHTNCRKTIGLLERITVTLRYLATGESFAAASYHFKISPSEISIIVISILEIIIRALQNLYLIPPNEEKWIAIASGFKEKRKFPNVLGAVDGKHIRIQKPHNAGSLYYNYKNFHSIVLLTAVDSDYKFVIVDIGSLGRNSDAGIFENSAFGKMFKNNLLDLPLPAPIEPNGRSIPFVFIGDEAFRLTQNFLKPYPRRQLTREKRIFNYRLSFARGDVECTFGIMVTKFRIFERPIYLNPDKVDKIVMAAILLHNMIRVEDKVKYAEEEFAEMPKVFGAFSKQSLHVNSNTKKNNVNQSKLEARQIRDYFCTYFCIAGQVGWQNSKILDLNDSSSNSQD